MAVAITKHLMRISLFGLAGLILITQVAAATDTDGNGARI